ncbi:MAG: hypothetical protein DRP68_07105 [Candidatus Omnitrophota bacterium]|nr:MAG: hypothetical protein DRP68_07105 [Candidatus Omnitrophota bacterium]HDN85923.1 hypothetical protein [Candidatus Omnitrophota bacterium]
MKTYRLGELIFIGGVFIGSVFSFSLTIYGFEKDSIVAQQASYFRNPFLTPQEEEFFRTHKRKVIDYLALSGIIYSPQNAYAIFQGRILKKGDILDKKRIVDITPKEVILEDNKGKQYLVRVKK